MLNEIFYICFPYENLCNPPCILYFQYTYFHMSHLSSSHMGLKATVLEGNVWRDLFSPQLLFHLLLTRGVRGNCLSHFMTHTLREIRYLLFFATQSRQSPISPMNPARMGDWIKKRSAPLLKGSLQLKYRGYHCP